MKKLKSLIYLIQRRMVLILKQNHTVARDIRDVWDRVKVQGDGVAKC